MSLFRVDVPANWSFARVARSFAFCSEPDPETSPEGSSGGSGATLFIFFFRKLPQSAE